MSLQTDKLIWAKERIAHLEKFYDKYTRRLEKTTSDKGVQYNGIEVTQVITEEITQTVQKRVPSRLETYFY